MTNHLNYFFYQANDTTKVSNADSSLRVVKKDTAVSVTSAKGSVDTVTRETVTTKIPDVPADTVSVRKKIKTEKVRTEKKVVKKVLPVKEKKEASPVDSISSETYSEDSIAVTKDTVVVHHRTLFQPVKRHSMSPLKPYGDMLSILIIISVVLTGLLRIWAMKFLRELFNAAFFAQAASKMYSSVNMRNSKPSFVLSALFIFNTGIFIFESLTFYKQTIFGQEGVLLLLFIWGIILLFTLIKSSLYKFTGFVFDTGQIVGEYLFNASLLSKVFAIALVPIIAFIPFVNMWLVPNLIKIGAIMFIILYILQLIRGSRIFLQNTFSVFYMFLYFCALEILPLVILYKILVS